MIPRSEQKGDIKLVDKRLAPAKRREGENAHCKAKTSPVARGPSAHGGRREGGRCGEERGLRAEGGFAPTRLRIGRAQRAE